MQVRETAKQVFASKARDVRQSFCTGSLPEVYNFGKPARS